MEGYATSLVIPAQAGIQAGRRARSARVALDARFRGHDGLDFFFCAFRALCGEIFLGRPR